MKPGQLDRLYFSWNLVSVVAEICAAAGIPFNKIDLSKISGNVDGFYTTPDNDAYAGINSLSQIFMFDSANFGGVVHFVERGGEVVAEITNDDLVDTGMGPKRSERMDPISIPRIFNLEYFDLIGGLTPNKQISDRSLDARSKSELKADTSVILRTEDAARAAVISHKVGIEEQKGTYEFSLPDSWCWLTCSDIISLNGNRLRIDEVETNDGYQKYKATFDRKSAYSSSTEGIEIQIPSDPPPQIIEKTEFNFLDIPILRDADDLLGYYVAINPVSNAWAGAVVELSIDGGQTYIDSMSGAAWADAGVLLNGIPAHSEYYPDNVNSIRVKMSYAGSELQSATLAEMMSRLNTAVIGNEIVNFGEVDEIVPGTWEIKNFLRGRKGTAPVAHGAGERFIVLNRNDLFLIDADLFKLNRELTFRVTSIGTSESYVVKYIFNGVTQRERKPAYLNATRKDGKIYISWQGVGRIGAGTMIAMGRYFAGYLVKINGSEQIVNSTQIESDDPGGHIEISVSQMNSMTGSGPEARIVL